MIAHASRLPSAEDEVRSGFLFLIYTETQNPRRRLIGQHNTAKGPIFFYKKGGKRAATLVGPRFGGNIFEYNIELSMRR